MGKILSSLKVRYKYVLDYMIVPKPGPMSSVITGFSNLFFWPSLDFAAHGIKNVLNYLEELGQQRFFLKQLNYIFCDSYRPANMLIVLLVHWKSSAVVLCRMLAR